MSGWKTERRSSTSWVSQARVSRSTIARISSSEPTTPLLRSALQRAMWTCPSAAQATFRTPAHADGISVERARCLELDHDLDRLAVVHRPIAIGYTVEVRHPIEYAARIDPPSEDVRKQLVDVGAGRSRPAADADVLPEGDASRQGAVLRDADAADGTTTTRDLESGGDG